jgi:hypothetical protein
MREYPVKRGHYSKALAGDGLKRIMEETFGHVEEDGEWLVSSYKGLKKVRVKPLGKTKLLVETETANVPEGDAADTLKKYNEFLFRATGYTAKERKKMMSKVS